ncbi:hypothetical protein Gorai_004813 [Gossypium raimondii]|uniref:Uncharacterized protein n=1 Tax=Gossypium raimondii TaxID=29730 RepID=A0A7J8QJA5_GOSRA|nr:hypothetical protein [Gossypium raimondii]
MHDSVNDIVCISKMIHLHRKHESSTRFLSLNSRATKKGRDSSLYFDCLTYWVYVAEVAVELL